MKNFRVFVLFVFLCSPKLASAQAQWSMGYWTPWNGGNAVVSPYDIEWGGLTHIAHAWALVNDDGTLDLATECVIPNQQDCIPGFDGATLVAAAHSHGVQALLSVGQPYWLGQTDNIGNAVNCCVATLVNNIMSVVNSYGFDGVDIDWEPFNPGVNGWLMKQLAAGLRAQLGSRPLTATAHPIDYAYWRDTTFPTAHSYFDRIGVMTYDLGGLWDPYSWHNAPLYGIGQEVWSVDLAVARFARDDSGAANGVPYWKLSIGIPFFGWKWKGGQQPDSDDGITGPVQYWWTQPTLTQLSYQNIAPLIYSPGYIRIPPDWTNVPYLTKDELSSVR